MATFKICVFRNKQRADGKYPVSIRVCWQRRYSYLSTGYYVTEKQISKKNFTLKDVFIINELNRRIERFENLKLELGNKIFTYTAKELADYFSKDLSQLSGVDIDFVSFARNHIAKLISQGRKGTAGPLTATINALVDYCGGRYEVSVTEITARFLRGFESFLRSERKITRLNAGKKVTTTQAPLSDRSVVDYMTCIRTLFNAARDEYNDEELGVSRIAHYPFMKYKIRQAAKTPNRVLSIEDIRKIRDAEIVNYLGTHGTNRAELARDVLMLSFMLVGANTADLYGMEAGCLKKGRITYKRQKTRGRRSDQALISIRLEPEVLPLIEKYRDPSGKRVFRFYQMYASFDSFNRNVNKGAERLARECGITEDLTTYYMRHSWATIARNDCRVSKDDINLALNHVDADMKTTDIYIAKDWSIIDEANRRVLDMFR